MLGLFYKARMKCRNAKTEKFNGEFLQRPETVIRTTVVWTPNRRARLPTFQKNAQKRLLLLARLL